MLFSYNSSMFKSINEIDFILSRFKYFNQKISLDLLFKATRDGQKSSDFHKKCDGKTHQLIFIQTQNGVIFGGYTKEGFNSRNISIIDNAAFVFSFSKKKIYNVMYNTSAIYDANGYGQCFSGSNWFTIYIFNEILKDKSNTCLIFDSHFIGFTSDYELNNGEKDFLIKEIEVYQILFD